MWFVFLEQSPDGATGYAKRQTIRADAVTWSPTGLLSVLYLSVCLSVSVSLCLSICLCLSVRYKSKVSKVTVDLYSASSWTRLRCATASRKSALISTSHPVQPGTSTTLRDHGYGLVYYAMCLFTPTAFAVTHSSLTQRAGSGWVGLGALYCFLVLWFSVV